MRTPRISGAGPGAFVACAVLLFVTLSAPLEATGQPAGERGEPAELCLRPAPAADCRAFMVSEVGLGRRLLGSDPPGQRILDQMMEWRLVVELGAMTNRDPRSALGGSAVLRVGDEVVTWGVRGRYRRWRPNGDAWEWAAATLFASADPPPPPRGPSDSPVASSYDGVGFELGGAWAPASWIGLGMDLVAMPFSDGGWDVSLQPSVRFTGPAGLGLALVFGAVVATDPSFSD